MFSVAPVLDNPQLGEEVCGRRYGKFLAGLVENTCKSCGKELNTPEDIFGFLECFNKLYSNHNFHSKTNRREVVKKFVPQDIGFKVLNHYITTSPRCNVNGGNTLPYSFMYLRMFEHLWEISVNPNKRTLPEDVYMLVYAVAWSHDKVGVSGCGVVDKLFNGVETFSTQSTNMKNFATNNRQYLYCHTVFMNEESECQLVLGQPNDIDYESIARIPLKPIVERLNELATTNIQFS